jgi:hypothetical protein
VADSDTDFHRADTTPSRAHSFPRKRESSVDPLSFPHKRESSVVKRQSATGSPFSRG